MAAHNDCMTHGVRALDLPPSSRTKLTSKKFVTMENDGHENQ